MTLMVLIEYYHLSSNHALFSPVHLLCAFNISLVDLEM